jgi:triosephosphate isomerase
MLKTPLIIINFKTYKEATGKNALKLAKKLKKVRCNVAIAPQFVDIKELSKKTKLPVLVQHIDPIDYGTHTGCVLAKSVKEAGAVGSLINHSEHQMRMRDIKKVVSICRKNKLVSVVCAANDRIAREVAMFNPDFIAIEPPELIATGIAVSKAKPQIVSRGVKAVHSVNRKVRVLCGAGISSGKDVKRAIELGSVGVLVSSAVVRNRRPERILKEFVENTRKK